MFDEGITRTLLEGPTTIFSGDHLLAAACHVFVPLDYGFDNYAAKFSEIDILNLTQWKIEINGKDSAKGAREIKITPIASELNLLYLEWIERNRRLVDELSGGRIGYMHVPNTWYDGYREFNKHWQPNMNNAFWPKLCVR